MSRSVSAIEDETIRELLLDMGFAEYETEPGWAYDLAERLKDAGWKKPYRE